MRKYNSVWRTRREELIRDLAEFFGVRQVDVRRVLGDLENWHVNDRRAFWTFICERAPAPPPLTTMLFLDSQEELHKHLNRIHEDIQTLSRSTESLKTTVARRGISARLKDAICTRDGLKCRYCGKAVTARTLTIDHLLAVSHGGTNDERNLVVACQSCNSRKGGKFLSDARMKLLPPPDGNEELYEFQKLLATGAFASEIKSSWSDAT